TGDHKIVTLNAAAGLDGGNIRAAARFADAEGPNPFSAYGAWQEFGLLFFSAQFLNHWNGHIGLHQKSHVDAAAIGGAQGFDVSGGGPPILAATTPLGIDAYAEHTQVAGFAEQFAWEDAFVVPFRGVGRNFFPAEAAHRLADQIVLLSE